MIDIENLVIDNVSTALTTAIDGIFFTSEPTESPASFPAALLYEEDNSTYTKSLDLGMGENHATVLYRAEAYSNLSPGRRKAQCREIMAAIDTQMLASGFTRVGSGPAKAPNADDKIYRMVARYRAVISGSATVYRR